ncbi:uncharacterized protein LOC120384369 isoform X1 [Mauremys reevesii]|uniref:uncharacterized protein LOC120384369 isoform X1 n=2 Tax=Mauremys reevesii TaxID=260615 RepID=UPI00193EFB32|nr:uncharacterized protein LOC120384369 isoform X1 [Mauremys reevesii]
MGSAGGLCSSPRAWGCGWNGARLLCFAAISWGAAENTAAVIVVNQTTPSIHAMEGSEFTIECTFNTSNNSIKWFAEWYKTKNNVTAKVNNGTDRIILSADIEKRSLSLTVKKADVTNSGTYVCWVGSKDGTYPGTGTQVTIDGQPKAPVKCKKLCTEFSRKEIPQKLLKTYRKTEPSCPKAAIIFVTKKNREFCADPEENWVKEAVRQLNQASAPLNPPLSSTVTSAVVQEGAGVFHRVVGDAGSKRLLAHVACTPVEIPKLMVNQTPANIQESEGSNLTMECRFTELKNHRTLYVKWYKHNGTGGTKKELVSERGGGSAALDLEKGFASFTLKNVNVTDTGTYMCEVGSTAWNLSVSGAGTQVTITPAVSRTI